jgi:hypothetical protein
LEASQRILWRLCEHANEKYTQHRGRESEQKHRVDRYGNAHSIARIAAVWR